MDRMLVVVFQNESNALQGKQALLQLDADGSIGVYAYAIVARNPNGSTTVKQSEDFGPFGTLAGGSLESLLSLLGRPIGLAALEFSGASAHLSRARLGADFIEEVAEVLLPWRIAVIAEIAERWTTPVDAAMEAIGGVVLRRALSQAKNTLDVEDVRAIRADMAQLKAEQAKVHAGRKAKLQEKIDWLDSKLRAQFQKAKDRRRAAELEAQAKVLVLNAKAASGKAAASSQNELEAQSTASS